MTYVYYNGIFGEWDEIKIPLSDRAVFFGDGIYDAALGKCGKIYLADEHITRFSENAKKINIPLKFGRDELNEILTETVHKSGLNTFFLYFQLSAHSEERRHAPRSREKSNLLVCIKPMEAPNENKELALTLYPEIRQRFCNIKTINLLGSVLAAEAAFASECDETVFVDGEYITECSHSNISMIKDGELITHPKSSKILPGIMREELIKTAQKNGIPVKERPFSVSELYSADDILITSTSRLVSRAKSVDGAPVSRVCRSAGDLLIADMFKDFKNFC